MLLYLVRHGQTAWNAELRAQGHADIPLDPTGVEQARMLARAFAEVAIDLVISSDLQRASRTANMIAEAACAGFETTPVLRERSFGEWEGRPYSEIAKSFAKMAKQSGKDVLGLRPPKGESHEDVWYRLDAFVERIETFEGSVVVVSHGGTCSLLLAKLLRGTVETARSFRFSNTSVTELMRRPEGRYQMIRYDDVAHLEEPACLSGNIDGAIR